ncbi:uncharacterized protein TRIADDRAFT_28805 [Trichoplax adhaerens]|uniref:Uncharacterized protein n=1 Tax=Trichoplax adhaerens TaxID=10228 RepID=B3S4K2_TRIAD|nr:hypothetical protein TRIADDRAFT_28805 [Trichoplax adhaerens]EDV22482.1 hypothetical protein TRIADDRAFT_28805 [Trichoplax adhaerens]|eukprot:XP_002115026.1 hypothetical protein TRIADDRAFT_28805 [Trichoplax adhaerens]
MNQSNNCPAVSKHSSLRLYLSNIPALTIRIIFQCRITVVQISRNHIINNLVDAYVKQYPEKKRSDEDIEDLNAKNKITREMLDPQKFIKRARNQFGFTYYDSEGSNVESYDGDSSDEDERCRQCPGRMSYTSVAADDGCNSVTISSNTSGFTCNLNTIHISCQCCFELLPDRRSEPISDRRPPVQCEHCSGVYCNMYWRCNGASCVGCLSRFKDKEFKEEWLRELISGNVYETDILMNYLNDNHLTISDMTKTICSRLASNEYSTTNFSIEQALCHRCSISALRPLAYCYRNDIPNTELPAEVTRRPNCWYGKECRTQKNSLAHARNYNHICENRRGK